MIVEIIDNVSGGRQPIRLHASQLLVCNDDGTPIVVAGEYGPKGTQRVAHAADDDFNRVLKMFGYDRHVVKVHDISQLVAKSGNGLVQP